jgi:hypothetical protein
LPPFLRKFPGTGNPFLFLLYKHGWRNIFRNEKGFFETVLALFVKRIKNFIKRTFLYKPLCFILGKISEKKQMWVWEKSDKTGPPPHPIKQEVVKEYGKRFSIDILVETGTYAGEMVNVVKNNFKKIFSIELSPGLCDQAKKKFAKYPNIHIICGDSAKALPNILNPIRKPCLFWLDAHYSGGITIKGDIKTPIAEELKAILNHPVLNHVILIDDARYFVGENDYPTLKWLKNYVVKYRSNYCFKIKNDIIRIYPKNK